MAATIPQVQSTQGIAQGPLMDPTDLSALLGSFNTTPTATPGYSQYPGAMIGGAAQASLGQNLSSLLGQDNAAGLVGVQRNYDQQNAALLNAQNQDVANQSVAMDQYGLGQQQQAANAYNTSRDYNLSTMDNLASILGLI